MEDTPYKPLRVCDLLEEDKPREKALNLGINRLTDAELLAIIIGGGIPGVSVLDLARKMLQDHENRLDFVARMTMREMISKYKGIGSAKSVSLAAAFELGARVRIAGMSKNTRITGAQDVFELMRGKLEIIDWEEFWVLMLARNNSVKYTVCISQGGTVSTVVDVKLLLKRAIDCLADAIILVHNHPSGAIKPSMQDDALTSKIKKSAELLDIRVLDHVIIGNGQYYSYMDEGKL